MKLASDIIRRPLITEKSMDLASKKRYCFEVEKSATKPEIAAELLKRIVPEIQKTGRKVEILFDRGYLAADLFQAIHELDAVAVTRFKKNNNLYEAPERPAVPRRCIPYLWRRPRLSWP